MELPTPVKGPQKGFADLMGEDWWKLSEKDKERFVLLALEGLDRRGATASHSPYDYVDAMDKLLTAVPEFRTEYLEDLLVFAVYDNEPETRAAIDKIREETAKINDL